MTDSIPPEGSGSHAIAMLARIDERTRNLDSRYVQRNEFVPVQRIVYGLVSIMVISVIVAVLKLVIQ